MRTDLLRSIDGRFAAPVLALVLAVPMLWLAAPRMVAEIQALPGSYYMRDVSFGRPVPPPVLEVIETSQREALAVVDAPRYWENLSLAVGAKARTVGYVTPIGRLLLRQALADTRQTLVRTPLQARSWQRLSHMLMVLYGPNDDSAAALGMSLRTGPNEEFLFEARFLAISRLWDRLDPDAQDTARNMLRNRGAGVLANYAARYGEGIEMLRAAFAGEPEFLDYVDRIYELRLRMRSTPSAPTASPPASPTAGEAADR